MAFEIKGRVKSVSPVKQVTEKFAKRELILDIDGKYPQVLCFESSGDRNALLDDVGEGDMVTVHFDLRGRQSTRDDRVFNTLSIWKVNVDTRAAAPRVGGSSQSDDLPF